MSKLSPDPVSTMSISITACVTHVQQARVITQVDTMLTILRDTERIWRTKCSRRSLERRGALCALIAEMGHAGHAATAPAPGRRVYDQVAYEAIELRAPLVASGFVGARAGARTAAPWIMQLWSERARRGKKTEPQLSGSACTL
jgi:hypothetical protein